MPDVAYLNSLPYDGGAAPMVADDFVSQLHGPMGKRVRVFQAMEVPAGVPNRTKQGFEYDEAEIPDSFRVLFHNVMRDANTVDFGVIEQGIVQISNDARVIEFAPYDIIVVTDADWPAAQKVRRGATDTDKLVHPFTASIQKVKKSDGSEVYEDDYEVAATGIRWLSDVIDVDEVYSVRYRYHPVVEYLLRGEFVMQKGGDGQELPQRGYGQVKQNVSYESLI